MPLPLIPLALAGGAFLLFAGGGGKGAFKNLPPGLPGQPFRRENVTAKSGNVYTTDQWPPNAAGEIFVVAQMVKFAGPANVQPGEAWVSWFQQGSDKTKRRLWRAGAPGDRAAAEALTAIMLQDFGVPR